MSIEPIIYILIFVAVLALVQGAYLVIFGKSISMDGKVNRRLEMLDKGGNREQVLDQLRKEMTQHMKSQSIPIYSLLATKAQKANIAFSPTQIMMVMAVVSLAAFLMLTLFTQVAPPVQILISVLMGVGGVYLWISRKATQWINLISEQLPDAVDLMVRSLRVGHPFSSAINIAAKEVRDPLGTEIGIIADETAYGRDMGETLKAMAERLDNQDLRFLAWR